MNTLLGIDLGTTGIKVSLFWQDGRLLGSAYAEYPILVPQPGWAEQDPQDWWRGLVTGCQELQQRFPAEFGQIAGIGICGQMHTQVYLDGDDNILRPAITWMDQRSIAIVQRINEDAAARQLIYAETCNYVTPTYTAPQVKWVQENQPEVWARVETILVAKDYLKYLLTGQKAIDYAEATGTLVFDVARERWSEAAFDVFGIPRRLFPEVYPSDYIIGTVSRTAVQATGLKEGTPVANGASDNSASALGAGMVASGQATLIIGTAGVISVLSDRPLLDQRGTTMCWHYCLRQNWINLGIMQTAGESLNWFKNAFDRMDDPGRASGDVFESYNQSVEKVADGCGGLVFLPYLNGERTPYWDSYARGVFYGVNLATEKAHFIKAIMEGVSFGLRNCIETVEALGIQINAVRAVGGGLKSKVWLNTLGKILKKPVTTVSLPDTGNLGNILLCGKALGLYSSYEDAVADMVTTGYEVSYPDGSPVYDQQYEVFLELYDDLKTTFRKSAGV